MYKKFVVGLIFILMAASSFAGELVDIGDIGVGARTLGMGKAGVGGLDDASSIFTNPAALSFNSNLNIISMSGSILSDVNYVLFGLTEDFPLGRYGIGYVNASVGSIPITAITGTGSTQAVVQTGTSDYGSSIIYFTYGTKLSTILRGKLDNVSVGGTVKYFMQGFSGGGTSLQDAVGTGMDADLGVIWEVNSWANLGLTFVNFVPVSFGGKFVWQRNSEEDSIPMVTRVGGKFRLLGESGWRDHLHELNLLLDYESGRGTNRPTLWHTGLEYWPMDILALRLGIDQKPKATSTGTGVDNNLTGGVGFKYMGFTFDYAYHQFGELAENATHFFSMGFVGQEEREKIFERERNEGGAVPLTTVASKPALAAFNDIPAHFWARRPIEYLATLGIMLGYPNKTFRPNQALTRGELATLLVKAKGFKVEKVTESSFWDINSDSWVAPYVEVAVKRQYVKGYPDGSFAPNRRITRAEAATVFAKFSGLFVKSKVSQKVFPDVAKNHWAAPAILVDKKAGLYAYLSGKNFGPKKDLTRAEAAEILSKTPLVKKKIKELISGD